MSTSEQNETVIEEFMEGEPRAASWRELREALEGRLNAALAERNAAAETNTKRRAEADARVATLREQIRALATEEAVSAFVEDSVRVSLNRPRRPGSDFDDEFDEDEAGY